MDEREILATPYPQSDDERESDPLEDRLRREQERFSYALEAAGMVAWEWDPASDRVVRSRNAGRLLGLPSSGTGEEFLALVHPEDRERVRGALALALAEGGEYDEELRIVRPDGSVVWVADKGRVAPGADGQPRSVGGVIRDVTASRQAEEELRRSEQRLHAALTTIPVTSLDPFGIYSAIRDASGEIVDLRIEYVNDAACRANGMTREQQVRRTVLDILPHHRESGLFDIYCRVIETGEPYETDAFLFEWGSPPQRRWFDIRATKLGDGFAAAWRDVTWRLESEESLRRSEESLREADRRKDEFLATLAHELRNPLAPIRNAVQILRVQRPAEPNLEWAREVIDRQVQQLTRLVDDLLDVSRITRGKIELRRERVELAAILERALETSRPVVEAAHHRLTVTFPDGPLWLRADLTRMAQVLSNLINNAAKYTRPGGHIQVSAASSGGQAAVEVRDDGIGIQPEMLSRIFDLFAQVDTSLERAQGGLGIGLTIARSLVEMHGGTLEAASDGPGLGSVFSVRLPLAAGEAAEAPRGADRREHGAGARLRILVVDDNEDSADSLAVWLRLQGNEVWTAYDGPQALAVAREQRPELILLDIGMPGMSGYEVARRLRADPGTAGAVLVAMTGWGQEDDRRQSREAGIHHHLVKPLEPRVLEDLIARLDPRSP